MISPDCILVLKENGGRISSAVIKHDFVSGGYFHYKSQRVFDSTDILGDQSRTEEVPV